MSHWEPEYWGWVEDGKWRHDRPSHATLVRGPFQKETCLQIRVKIFVSHLVSHLRWEISCCSLIFLSCIHSKWSRCFWPVYVKNRVKPRPPFWSWKLLILFCTYKVRFGRICWFPKPKRRPWPYSIFYLHSFFAKSSNFLGSGLEALFLCCVMRNVLWTLHYYFLSQVCHLGSYFIMLLGS